MRNGAVQLTPDHKKRPRGAFGSVIQPAYQHQAASVSFSPIESSIRSDWKMICSVWKLRLVTSITIGSQRNSGPGGSRCCSCGSSAGSCCGSPSGNSPRRCSNCRHGSRGSSPQGSFTKRFCNTDCRNRQLLTPAAVANAVRAVSRFCNSNSEINPNRSARSSTRTRLI